MYRVDLTETFMIVKLMITIFHGFSANSFNTVHLSVINFRS